MNKEIKKLRINSYIGLFIFMTSLIMCYEFLGHVYLGFLSIIMLVIGWFIFSKNHTTITKIQLKQITDEYLKDKLKKT